jgi:ParB-like chromosome segregation protein Spo0J
MLDEGAYSTVSEIGDAENVSKSYISRILRLALLAPDIVEAIVAGQTDQALVLEQLERPLPASWVEQRARLAVNVVSPKATPALRASH